MIKGLNEEANLLPWITIPIVGRIFLKYGLRLVIKKGWYSIYRKYLTEKHQGCYPMSKSKINEEDEIVQGLDARGGISLKGKY